MGKKCGLSNHFLIKTPITKRRELAGCTHTHTHSRVAILEESEGTSATDATADTIATKVLNSGFRW